MKATPSILVALFIAGQSLAAPSLHKRLVGFDVSTEPNNQGFRKTYVVSRGQCKNFADDGLDHQISYAFVDAGLANGCMLFDTAGCQGAQYNVVKNKGNTLGPGQVNLKDVNFDKKASSFECY